MKRHFLVLICVFFFFCCYTNTFVKCSENDAEPVVEESQQQSNEDSTTTKYRTAVDLLQDIYKECVQDGSFTCVKPKVLAFISSSMEKDKIRLTRDLSIVRSDSSAATPKEEASTLNEINKISELDEEKKQNLKLAVLDKLDEFISTHELKIRVPREISMGYLPPFVPPILTKNLPDEIKFPLAGSSDDQFSGRSSKKILKRIVMPFLLGLKFKATTVAPLAFALIALKTWKAFTFALLSLVLSAAMVIYKFTNKPKVSYELIHYPQPVAVYPDHGHHEHHTYARKMMTSPHNLAYRAHADPTAPVSQ